MKHITEIEYLNKVFRYKGYIHYKFKRTYSVGAEYRINIMTILPIEDNKCYLIVYDMD